MNRYVICGIAILLVSAGVIYSQWGTSGCHVASASVDAQQVQFTNTYWYNPKDGMSWIWLINSEKECIGMWETYNHYYRSWDGRKNKWGAIEQNPPIPLPEQFEKARPIFGVVKDKIVPNTYTYKGQDITPIKALELIHESKIPNDSDKFRLTIIGSPDETLPIQEAVKTLELSLLNRIVVWRVTANNTFLKDNDDNTKGFDTSKFNIYFTAPDGKVLHRQSNFNGIGDLVALRKAVNKYDADKDPDLRKPDPKPIVPLPNPPPLNPEPSPVTPELPTWAWLLFGVFGLVFGWNNREFILNLLKNLPTPTK